MLTICVGKTGSGKSLYAMHLLVREARTTTRPIVTTLGVITPQFNEYLQRSYPKETHNICQRLHIIEKESLVQFWRHRGLSPGYVPIVRGPFGNPSWHWPDNGVCYILDELQCGFSARHWQSLAAEFTEYITQHRKLGDDIVGITPSSSLIDKQFRSMAHQCIVLDNWYQRKIGWFTSPRKIVWFQYANCPPLQNEKPDQKGSIHIDPHGLADCYRTEQGVGITGNIADKGKSAKGIPWWAVFLALAVTAVSLMWLVRTATHWGLRSATTVIAGSSPSTAVHPAVPPPTNTPQTGPPVPILSHPVSTNEVRWSGMAQIPGPKLLIFLSDGSTWKFPSPGVQVTPYFCTIHGQTFQRAF